MKGKSQMRNNADKKKRDRNRLLSINWYILKPEFQLT